MCTQRYAHFFFPYIYLSQPFVVYMTMMAGSRMGNCSTSSGYIYIYICVIYLFRVRAPFRTTDGYMDISGVNLSSGDIILIPFRGLTTCESLLPLPAELFLYICVYAVLSNGLLFFCSLCILMVVSSLLRLLNNIIKFCIEIRG